MIDLSAAVLLGEGNERSCYVHPSDPGLVIKVQRPGVSARGQNRIEQIYLSELVRRGAPFDHIPRLLGTIPTSLGEGLVCERIADPDGGSSLPLAMAVHRGALTREHADRLLDEIFAHLLRHWIVFADVGGDNLVCQRMAGGGWRVVIIDGLGARHPGMKLWLHRKIPWLARLKVRKQWPKLLENLWNPREKS